MKNILTIFIKLPSIIKLFYIMLLLTTLISGYIFFRVLFLNDTSLFGIFSSWQFPMLLALFVDTIYLNPSFMRSKNF